MQKIVRNVLGLMCAAALLSQASAQSPGPKSADTTSKAGAKDYSQSSIVIRMMAFDKNHDGKLTKDEITDARLHRLFDRADVNKDGIVTKEELMALAAQLDAEFPQRGGRGGFGGPGGDGNPGGFGGPGGPGGPGGRGRGRFGGRGGPDGPGGPGPGDAGPGRSGGPGESGPGGFGGPGGGGPGRFGGPPRPGQILPPFLQEELNLSAPQKKQLEELQKEVDSRLGKILTEDQKKQLQERRRGFGPGGPPPDGPPPDGSAPGQRGRRGRGGAGGPPGGDQADRPAP
jgi:hypothetical protein